MRPGAAWLHGAVNLHAAHRAFQVQLAADGRSELLGVRSAMLRNQTDYRSPRVTAAA